VLVGVDFQLPQEKRGDVGTTGGPRQRSLRLAFLLPGNAPSVQPGSTQKNLAPVHSAKGGLSGFTRINLSITTSSGDKQRQASGRVFEDLVNRSLAGSESSY